MRQHQHHLVSPITTIIVTVTFLCALTVTAAPANHHRRQDNSQDIISINCGSITPPPPPTLGGKHWLADANPSFLTLKGSSTTRSSSSAHAKLIPSVIPVPYTSARISRSKFSYSFHLSPGQKFIRLHFNPDSYDGFQNFGDLFDVKAGPFALLSNFSASITADALAVLVFVKEFCITVQENQLLEIIFTPVSSYCSSYAFVNGIEIISLPASLSYCLGGDTGVRVVGQNSVVYIDNATALEMIHRLSIKRNSVLPVDDFPGMFGVWRSERVVGERGNNGDNSVSWKVPVDIGFRYLVRVHFCELGLKLGRTNFKLLIDHVIVNTRADVVEEKDVNGILWYRNHMVEVKGRKDKGKRDILISLHSDNEVADRHGPIERFEIFKLSNHDDSLASLNPSPPAKDSPIRPIKSLLLILGQRNAFATVVITAICLINIAIHMLQQFWEDNSIKEESKPSNRARRICRLFSFSEIQSATDDFHDAFIIGSGGFGKVYRGIIDYGLDIVAIKRLKPDSRQGEREFWTEIEMLSELRHNNVVSLIGYCNEQKEMILVYEYMPGGTLADHLYKFPKRVGNIYSLSWEERLKICIGSGRGLDYLHTGHKVIHRDVKPSNVLLDENFVAKVSDFGLARIENEDSTKLKGTFGYIDPDYSRTSKLTLKSDTYSFGVVLLEVLCGRKAVDPSLGEGKQNLAMWAQKSISEGDVDQIVAPSLRGDISPDSLKAFLEVAIKCLHDEPQQRPAIAHVVINLEFALEQQKNAEPLVPNQRKSIADFFPQINRTQQETPKTTIPREENTRSLSTNEITSVVDVLPRTDTFFPVSGRQFTVGSFTSQKVTSVLKGQTIKGIINTKPPQGQNNMRKNILHKLSRLWPQDAFWSRKLSNRKDLAGSSISATVALKSSKKRFVRFSTVSQRLKPTLVEESGSIVAQKSTVVEESDKSIPASLPAPNLRIFSYRELKAATRNFRSDKVLGEGGFGKVYKGWLDDKSTAVAVKKLNSESMQGFQEWQSEVNFLGRLQHPNLVKLLGYCWDDKELLLVYEFMQKGSLENHLFGTGSAVQPLPWEVRLRILIGAARGLAFLHAANRKVIYRDFKASNILLDTSYHSKLSDFGLAKMGPTAGQSHVTTQVMGTYGYAAPEYVATGHLYVKSDVYGFGVVLVEMLAGLRALDTNRPSGQHNLVDWIKPRLADRRKLKNIIDFRLKGVYPSRYALKVAQLALNCLENEPKNRPSMQEIVETLETIDSASDRHREPRVARSSHQAAARHSQQHLQYRSPLHPRQEANRAYPLPQRT